MATPAPTTISLPIILDLSAQQIVIFGEQVAEPDASFNLTCGLSLNDFKNSLLYKDNESGSMDISFVQTAALGVNIDTLTNSASMTLANVYGTQNLLDYTQFSKGNVASVAPTAGHLGEHFVQYVASLLFGHPQAQAPIQNDTAIMADLSNDKLGQQFVDALAASADYRHSMIEQLINADASGLRFDIEDTTTYRSYPFVSGDKIVFRVRMQGNLVTDSSSGLSGSTASILGNLFSGIVGIDASNVQAVTVEPRLWKITATLA
jgi:hypothetical protein